MPTFTFVVPGTEKQLAVKRLVTDCGHPVHQTDSFGLAGVTATKGAKLTSVTAQGSAAVLSHLADKLPASAADRAALNALLGI